MEVIAVAIHEINGYYIHIFKRTGHDNKYVKIVKNKVRGKYILAGEKKGWQKHDLDTSTQNKITQWIEANIDFILDKIKELDNA